MIIIQEVIPWKITDYFSDIIYTFKNVNHNYFLVELIFGDMIINKKYFYLFHSRS